METKDSEFLKRMENYAARLAVAGDLRALFRTVEEIIAEIVDVKYIILYYYVQHTGRLKAVNSKGLTKSARFQAERTAMDRHPGEAWRRKETLYFPFADQESDYFALHLPNRDILNSRLYIPLFKNENCIGVFSLACSEADKFSKDMISILSFVTNLAAVIYKNLIDTRELIRINQRLKEENKNFLSQKLQSIGQLAAGIAHELNTPLQYVGDNISFLNNAFEMMSLYFESVTELSRQIKKYSHDEIASILDKTMIETDIQFFLQEIPPAVCQSLDGLEKLNRIIKTIKDFAAPGIKDKSFKNINKSVEDTILLTRNEWKTYAEIVTDLNEELPLIYCMTDEINQVILQLIINAVEAIKEKTFLSPDYKSGVIHIKSEYNKNGIVLHVQDDGIGIQDKYLDKIFDPFFTTKDIGKGTGQGLAIAHDVICNKHHGEIFVESNYLNGTKFIVKLPYS